MLSSQVVRSSNPAMPHDRRQAPSPGTGRLLVREFVKLGVLDRQLVGVDERTEVGRQFLAASLAGFLFLRLRDGGLDRFLALDYSFEAGFAEVVQDETGLCDPLRPMIAETVVDALRNSGADREHLLATEGPPGERA